MDQASPTLSNTVADRLHDLAQAHRVLEMEGHGDLTLGHMSARDPEGRGFWLKCQGLGLSEIREPSHFVLLDYDGKLVEGDGWVHSEWPIHSEIYRRREDVEAIGHTHAFHACVFSATGETLRAIAHEGAYFAENVPHYKETSELINTIDMGRNLAETLDDAHAVFMGNHGVTFCGGSIMHAMMMGIWIEKACHAQLLIGASGYEWSVTGGEELKAKATGMVTQKILEGFWAYYGRILKEYEAGRRPRG